MADYGQLVRRWWWLAIVLVAAGAAVGYVASQRLGREYQAETTLIVTASNPSPQISEQLIPDDRNALVKTYLELLLTRPVLESVIAELGLQTTPERLAEHMAIRDVSDTQLLVLSARDPDPQRAADIANATVAAFNRAAPTLLANPYAAGRAGLSVVAVAVPPAEPAGPGPLRSIVLGAIIGLLIAVGAVTVAEALNRAVRNESDVVQLTGLAPLIAIGTIDGSAPADRLATLRAPQSREAEVYRMARLALDARDSEAPVRTLLISGVGARAGASLTAANIAIALTQTGLRVILIDANLRRPVAHELFGQPNDRGLTTALLTEAPGRAYEHTVDSDIDNLRLLLSGPPTAPPVSTVRTLAPHALAALVEELASRADVLIIDGPPMLEFIDASLLARSCDAALLVARAGRTTAEDLGRARDALARSPARLLGVVLNYADRSAVGMLGAAEGQLPSAQMDDDAARQSVRLPAPSERVRLLRGDRERTTER